MPLPSIESREGRKLIVGLPKSSSTVVEILNDLKYLTP